MKRYLTVNEVAACYRLFLGRQPESDMIVFSKLNCQAWEVVAGFLTSEEFTTAVLPCVLDPENAPGPSRHTGVPDRESVALAVALGCLEASDDSPDWNTLLRRVLFGSSRLILSYLPECDAGAAALHLAGLLRLFLAIVAAGPVKAAATDTSAAGIANELGPLRDALNQTVWRAEKTCLELAERIARQQGSLESLQDRVEELADPDASPMARVVAQQRDALNQTVWRAEKTSLELAERIARQQGSLESLQNRVEELADPDAGPMGKAVAQQCDALNQIVWRAEKTSLELAERIARQQGSLESLQDRVEELADPDAGPMGETMARQREALAQAVEEAQQQHLRLQTLEGRVVAGEDALADLGQSLRSAAQEQAETLAQALAAQESRGRDLLDALGGRIDEVAEHTPLPGQLEGLSAIFNGLSERFDEHVVTVQAQLAAVNAATSATAVVAERISRENDNNARDTRLIISIINDTLRPMGLIFPQDSGPDPAKVDAERQRLAQLPLEKSPPCLVCRSQDFEDVGEAEGLVIERCGQCGFMQPEKRIAKDQLHKFYSLDYWKAYQSLHGLAEIESRALYDYNHALSRVFLLKRFRPSGRLLDIGCGLGALVRRAGEFGYKSAGLEMDPALAELARAYYGITVFTGGLDALGPLQRRRDIVTMFDVFEHLYDPDRDLTKIHGMLSPGGLFVMETFHTDCDSFAANPMGHPDCKPIEHVGMYKEEHLDALVARNGFEVAETCFPLGRNHTRVIKICVKK